MSYEGLWYKAPEDLVYGRWIKSPYDKVFIGCDPTDGMTPYMVEKFDAFVNVSDSECETLTPYPNKPQIYLWYPLNEVGLWGMDAFFWSVKILTHLLEQNKTIYWHCHAGAHRSPITFYAYLLCKGHSLEEADKICGGWSIRRMLYEDIRHRRISPFLFSFLEAIRRQPTYSLMGVLNYAQREFEWGKYFSENTPHQFRWEGVLEPSSQTEYEKKCTLIMSPWLNKNDLNLWLSEPEESEILFASQEHISKQ